MIATLCAVSLAPGQDPQTDTKSMDQTAVMRPSPAKLAIWTDRLGYPAESGQLSVYLAMAPMGDGVRYTEFTYLENIATGRRTYFAREAEPPRVRDEIMDARGRMSVRTFETRRVDTLAPTRIWTGPVPQPGQWQFVAELRSPDTTEVVKTAHAKFVVSEGLPVAIGAGGTDTEIAVDTTWTADRIHAIRHQVFRQRGRDADDRTRDAGPRPRAQRRHRRRERRPDHGGRAPRRADRDDLRRTGRPTIGRLLGRADRPRQSARGVRDSLGRGRGSGGAAGVRRGRSRGLQRRAAIRAGRVRGGRSRLASPAGRPGLARRRVGHGDRPCPGARERGRRHPSSSAARPTARTACRAAPRTTGSIGPAAGRALSSTSSCSRTPAKAIAASRRTAPDRRPARSPARRPGSTTSRSPAARSKPRRANAKGVGIVLRGEDALTARNLIVTGFPAGRGPPAGSLTACLHSRREHTRELDPACQRRGPGRGRRRAPGQFLGRGPAAGERALRGQSGPAAEARLAGARDRCGGNGAAIRTARSIPRGQSIGAFSDSNWLEEWTFFGDESDYVPPE